MNYLSPDYISQNRYKLLGHISFFILLLFSILFAKERVLYLDSAYQVFVMIKDGTFLINVNRYSMFLSQLLPLLALKLNAPLWVIVYLYSISFSLIAYAFWLITVYGLKNERVGTAMLFTFLGISSTFFHCISETFQLMFFAFFLYAWITFIPNLKNSILSQILYYLIAFLIIGLCVFIHPAATFFIIFILGFCFFDKNIGLTKKIVLSLLSVGWIVFKLSLFEAGSHDSTFMVNKGEIFSLLKNIFHLGPAKMFFANIHQFYFIPILLGIFSLCFYYKKKQFLKLIYLAGFCVGYWIIACIIYHKESYGIAMERTFLPLFFYTGLAFAVDVLPALTRKQNNIFFIGLSVLLLFSFVRIGFSGGKHGNRIKRMAKVIDFAQEQNERKLILTQDTDSILRIHDGWALSLETMIYSSMKDPNATVNIYLEENSEFDRNDWGLHDVNVYPVAHFWKYWQMDELNTKYFRLPREGCKELVVIEGNMAIKDI